MLAEIGEPTEHAHEWSAGTETTRSQVSCSPCSAEDDHLWDDVLLVQTCPCGSVRQVLVGFRNRRRRGDDGRRARGLRPLGEPLRASGTYRQPKVLGVSTPGARGGRNDA